MKTLTLAPDQKAAVEAGWLPGHVLIAKVAREPFTGANHETSGTLSLEFGHVPCGALLGMRAAIEKAKQEARLLNTISRSNR